MLSKNNISFQEILGKTTKFTTSILGAMKSSEKLRVRDYLAIIYYFICLIEHFREASEISTGFFWLVIFSWFAHFLWETLFFSSGSVLKKIFLASCPRIAYTQLTFTCLKVNNANTGKRCEICSQLTIKLPERRRRRSRVFVNFGHIIKTFSSVSTVNFE